jgi:hypothetical protein
MSYLTPHIGGKVASNPLVAFMCCLNKRAPGVVVRTK